MEAYRKEMMLMGNRFEITVVTDSQDVADHCIDKAVAEIQRIESLLSTFKETSETNAINRKAGIAPVKVSKETLDLIMRANHISKITQGAFDISYGSIDKRFWNFDQSMDSLPDRATAKALVRLINYRNIEIDEIASTIFLREEGMRIGFGGIGKGYAAERAKQVLKEMGVQSGIVNASGDLTVWGHQPDGAAWTIGIAHPDAKQWPFSYFELNEGAVATSGNYEKFVVIKGKKYSHTIDPRTGFPITGIKSVTVMAPHAELCDALATPVTIMGIDAGLHFIDQLGGVSCVIIDDDNRLYHSKNIHLT